MKKNFPVSDPAAVAGMWGDIGSAVEKHLGFSPVRMVLIVHDGKDVQTLFASGEHDDYKVMGDLLIGSAQQHIEVNKRGYDGKGSKAGW